MGLRGPAADALDEPGAREIVRELKAVGGNLKFLRLALTGPSAGPSCGRSSPPCRATRRFAGSPPL